MATVIIWGAIAFFLASLARVRSWVNLRQERRR